MRDMEVLFNSTPEEREEMSDIDVFSAGVNVTARKMHADGVELLQLNTELNSVPSIWFKVNDKVSFIVVTVARYPRAAEPPKDALLIDQQLSAEGFNGYWVGVTLANEFDAFDPESDEGLPLMKGFGLIPKILDPIPLREL